MGQVATSFNNWDSKLNTNLYISPKNLTYLIQWEKQMLFNVDSGKLIILGTKLFSGVDNQKNMSLAFKIAKAQVGSQQVITLSKDKDKSSLQRLDALRGLSFYYRMTISYLHLDGTSITYLILNQTVKRKIKIKSSKKNSYQKLQG